LAGWDWRASGQVVTCGACGGYFGEVTGGLGERRGWDCWVL